MEYFLLDTKEGKEKAILNIKNCPENYVCKIEPRNRTKEQNNTESLTLKDADIEKINPPRHEFSVISASFTCMAQFGSSNKPWSIF